MGQIEKDPRGKITYGEHEYNRHKYFYFNRALCPPPPSHRTHTRCAARARGARGPHARCRAEAKNRYQPCRNPYEKELGQKCKSTAIWSTMLCDQEAAEEKFEGAMRFG